MAAVGAALAGIVVALVFVRVSLAWSDSQPYDPGITEPRYLAFIAVAALIVAAGAACAILIWKRNPPP